METCKKEFITANLFSQNLLLNSFIITKPPSAVEFLCIWIIGMPAIHIFSMLQYVIMSRNPSGRCRYGRRLQIPLERLAYSSSTCERRTWNWINEVFSLQKYSIWLGAMDVQTSPCLFNGCLVWNFLGSWIDEGPEKDMIMMHIMKEMPRKWN